jgi:sugar lactone lactonase YvrE
MRRTRVAGLIELVELGMLAVLGGCFHPVYDRPECGPDGECPAGLTCSATRICSVGSEPPVDPPPEDGGTTSEPPSVEVLAGVVSRGSTDDTGAAARFYGPGGVAVDAAGNVYVADTGNHTIRKVTAAGAVTTFAGAAGVPGSTDGPGSAARFAGPSGIAVDRSGNLYVADRDNHTIRKITSSGVVTTLAGKAGQLGTADGTGSAAAFYDPSGVAVDSAGNVYVADTDNYTIRKVTAGGTVTTLAGSPSQLGSADGTGSAASFDSPSGVAVDGAGTVYVADYYSRAVRVVTAAGVVTTLAGAADSPGSTDGTGSAAQFSGPDAVAIDSAGNLYVADQYNYSIRKVTASGVVTTLAGGELGTADGVGKAAGFDLPAGIAVDGSGNVYVADTSNNTIRKVTAAGVVTTLAGLPGGSADGTGTAARFRSLGGVAMDSAGNAYVADRNNNSIRKITLAGVVTTLAGAPSTYTIDEPLTVAVDGAGNVYAACEISEIVKVTAAGAVTMLPRGSSLLEPAGVAVDRDGNLYATDRVDSTVVEITAAGAYITLAGTSRMFGSTDGTGASARFDEPSGVAIDSTGNLYVADTGNATIRKVTSAGVVTTLAGTPRMPGTVDGTGAAARFTSPSTLATDAAGNVYVVAGPGSIRKVTPDGVTSTIALDPAIPGFLSGLAITGDSIVVTDDSAVIVLRHFAR